MTLLGFVPGLSRQKLVQVKGIVSLEHAVNRSAKTLGNHREGSGFAVFVLEARFIGSSLRQLMQE